MSVKGWAYFKNARHGKLRKSQQNTPNPSACSPIIIIFCVSVLVLPSHLPHTIRRCKRSAVQYSETVLYKILCHDNRVLVFTAEETFGPPSSSPDEYFPRAVPPRPRDTAPLCCYYVLFAVYDPPICTRYCPPSTASQPSHVRKTVAKSFFTTVIIINIIIVVIIISLYALVLMLRLKHV